MPMLSAFRYWGCHLRGASAICSPLNGRIGHMALFPALRRTLKTLPLTFGKLLLGFAIVTKLRLLLGLSKWTR